MTKLEELDIEYCFNEWGEEVRYKNTWIRNAQLSELNCLSHLSILRVWLSNLREIMIYECDMMEEIVSIEIEDQITICTSPLTSLHIEGVNRLTSCFCSTKSSIQQSIVSCFDQRQVSFPQLEYLSIRRAN
ncbi:hypothetical protein IC582_025351 [Cucumis melo]